MITYKKPSLRSVIIPGEHSRAVTMYFLNPSACFLLCFLGVIPLIAAQPVKHAALQRLHHHHTHHLHSRVQKSLQDAGIEKIVRELGKSDLINRGTDPHQDDIMEKVSRSTR